MSKRLDKVMYITKLREAVVVTDVVDNDAGCVKISFGRRCIHFLQNL